jgi:hypothetical protein
VTRTECFSIWFVLAFVREFTVSVSGQQSLSTLWLHNRLVEFLILRRNFEPHQKILASTLTLTFGFFDRFSQMQLINDVYAGWRDLMDNKSDPRTRDWPLMSSPFPTMAISICYAIFVTVSSFGTWFLGFFHTTGSCKSNKSQSGNLWWLNWILWDH